MNTEALNSANYEINKPESIITFRNNIGMYYNENGAPICYGVAGKPSASKPSLGGSDFIGWESVIISQDMVGQRVAIFTAHEIKGDDTPCTSAQENFIARVNSAGGRSGFVRRPIDVQLISEGRGCTILRDYPKAALV